MNSTPVIAIQGLVHRYCERRALDGLALTLAPGCFCSLLGPNGSGKTTLFRLLATLLAPQEGSVRVLGLDPVADAAALRRQLGVVFQSPSLDRLLTVRENLTHHGLLFGLYGAALAGRIDELLRRMGLADRAGERVGRLSGGLARRVELARCLLHRPQLLLLDEPTTGLDPVARREFWQLLHEAHEAEGAAILFTTHWFEEAEPCAETGIMDQGRLVAFGSPEQLKRELGGEIISVTSPRRDELERVLREEHGVTPTRLHRTLRFENRGGPDFVSHLLASHGDLIGTITVGKPTLEDVFIQRTGHELAERAGVDGEGQ